MNETNEHLMQMASLANIASNSLDETVRIRGEALKGTLMHIQQLKSVLYTMEASASVQHQAIRVAFIKAQSEQ